MFLTLSILLTGLSLYLVFWVMVRPAALRPFAAGDHGNHLLLRIAWPWVVAAKPMCEPLVSWRTRAILTHQMRLAAMDPVWTPADILALQCVVFIVAGLVACSAGWMMTGLTWGQLMLGSVAVGLACAWMPRHWIVAKGAQRQRQMLRELPFLLDMTTLCVEAGLNLQGALQRAAHYGPAGPLRNEVLHTIAEIRAGTARMDALSNLAERTGLTAIASLVSALKQADQTGSSLGPMLRFQSDQRRSEQFLRAEELALKAPVKMLFPLVLCIFPCTFLIIGFPVAIKVLAGVQ